MTLTDEQLDALAERLEEVLECTAGLFGPAKGMRAVAREAASWAAEQQGEVQWQYEEGGDNWRDTSAVGAVGWEREGYPVRAIRVIATTTKEGV